jgi:hypothetical protein
MQARRARPETSNRGRAADASVAVNNNKYRHLVNIIENFCGARIKEVQEEDIERKLAILQDFLNMSELMNELNNEIPNSMRMSDECRR